MHYVLVVVFDNEVKADEGKTELLRLDSEGRISIYGYEVIEKKEDGTAIIRQADGHGTLSPFAKSLLGVTDSMRSDPESEATRIDDPTDSTKTETGEDFIRGVMEVLLPNRVAIVAEMEEEWPTVVDRHMASIARAVFRWTVSEAQHAVEM